MEEKFKMFCKDFPQEGYGAYDFLQNWPMLYFLENGEEMYIGESGRVTDRLGEHAKNLEKDIFDKVHLIYSDKLNKSATLDYESKLIQYMSVDNKRYRLTNKNEGIADREYYKKEEYEELFLELWKTLQKKKLVKDNINKIRNSDLFKYSPYKELTREQKKILNKLMDRLRDEQSSSTFVKGFPGTGKTVVCTFLMKYLRDQEEFRDKKIALVIPQVSLRNTLEKLFKKVGGLSEDNVIGPYEVIKEEYDILIVDEAHRLTKRKNIVNYGGFDNINTMLELQNGDQMDWIIRSSKKQIFFYDALQVIGPAGIQEEEIKKKYDMAGRLQEYESQLRLSSQVRVQGGDLYINYIVDLLNGTLKRKKNIKNYEFKVVEDFGYFNQLLYEKEKESTLSRMAAGYAWEWKSKGKKNRDKIDIVIESASGKVKKQWNYKTVNWVHSKQSIDQVGCIHSLQGYDLNYAFIIIGNDLRCRPGLDGKPVLYADKSNYYDRNGKNGTEEEELFQYIKNVYYVLMTRGIKGTYLYICDKGLRDYFKKYVDVIE